MSAKAYVTNTDSDDISVVDVEGRKEVHRLTVGGSPRGSVRFDPEGNFGYVSNCAGNTISVIDLGRDREVAKIQVGLAPRGLILSKDGNFAYVSNSGDNTLSVVNLTERKEVARHPMGENPRHMALSQGLDRFVVSQWGSDSLAVIDISAGNASLRSMRSVSVGKDARPYSLNILPDGKTALVANTQASSRHRIWGRKKTHRSWVWRSCDRTCTGW